MRVLVWVTAADPRCWTPLLDADAGIYVQFRAEECCASPLSNCFDAAASDSPFTFARCFTELARSPCKQATAHVLLNENNSEGRQEIKFSTKSGLLTVR